MMKFNGYCGIAAVAGLLLIGNVHAFNMGEMMNPSKWTGFGGIESHAHDAQPNEDVWWRQELTGL